MATFTYEALNEAGKPQKGTIEASTQRGGGPAHQGAGLFPTDVREQKVKKSVTEDAEASAKKKKKRRAMGFGASRPSSSPPSPASCPPSRTPACRCCARSRSSRASRSPASLKNILMGVTEEVEGGTASPIHGQVPQGVRPLYTKMVAAGEIGGVLDIILQRLAEFMEKSQRLKRKIRGAMVYPDRRHHRSP
jgi:type IV pilus assembly protein PilC